MGQVIQLKKTKTDQNKEPKVDIEKKLYDLEQKIGMLEISLTLAKNCQTAYKKQFKLNMITKYGEQTTKKNQGEE